MSESPDLLRRIARVGAEIDPALSDRDVERLVAGGRARARRRQLARTALVCAAAGAAAVIFVLRRPIDGSHATAPTLATAPKGIAPPAAEKTPARAAPLRLADGSVATPLDDASAIALRERSARRVTLDLVRGRGRFEVTPRAERAFSVRAGDVTITVLGTVFTVERVADRIGVGVERGRVLVDWGTGTRRLEVGESGWFPPLATSERLQPAAISAARAVRHAPREPHADSAPSAPEAATPAAPPAPAASVQPPSTAPSPPARVRAAETAESLLAAADVARLDGRARDGAALLRRALTDHRTDPRAPLAAFTLGRVLLMDLGEARAAATAFAEARALSPAGPFAEDALAREVEALAKAGDTGAAHARARDYQRLYPNGRRASAVRAFGGGE